MSKEFKVLWTENSVQDLLIIKAYIAQDSSESALAWIEKLYKAGESLRLLPHRGRVVPEFKQNNLRELLIDNYRIVYRVNESALEILTVFEAHRQLHTLPANK